MKQTRSTKQKLILEEELKNKKTFFTAEEFHFNIKKNSKIGIATVYRFLNEKVSENVLHKYTCNRRTLFYLEKKTHAHFYCENCSVEKHIEIKNLDFLKKDIPGEVCHFQIDITGICKKCKKD